MDQPVPCEIPAVIGSIIHVWCHQFGADIARKNICLGRNFFPSTSVLGNI